MGSKTLQAVAALAVACVGLLVATVVQWPVSPTDAVERRSNGTHEWAQTVILISLDGLKPAYLQSGHLEGLHNLSLGQRPNWLGENIGVLTADAMMPVSPSLTFPNHWSLQTGLQPSSHGIVANDFHSISPTGNQSFYYTDPNQSWDPHWWKGTSIWEQLEKMEIKTANLMWPGPPLTLSNRTNSYFQKYEKGWTADERVSKMMSWLDLDDDDRPRFVCGYVPDVDSVTHSLGPDMEVKEVQSTLRAVDALVSDVLRAIDERNATSMVSVIVVSDHGMTATSNDRLLYLEDLLGPSLFSNLLHWDGWPNVGLQFGNQTLLEEASRRLRRVSNGEGAEGRWRVASRDEAVKLWKWEMTEAVRERVAELWILPALGWSVTTREEMSAFKEDYRPKGNHGYDASNEDMLAFFLALGPAFGRQKRKKMDTFANLEIHNLVMDLMRIAESDRAPNNGTIGFWKDYIRPL